MSGKETKDSANAVASTASPPTSAAPSAVEAIEEDDEFEEFEPCQWNANDEDAEDSQQWQVRDVLGKCAFFMFWLSLICLSWGSFFLPWTWKLLLIMLLLIALW